jgi:hypothetical protein
MATTRTSRGSSLVGWFFLAAGLVFLIGILVTHISATIPSTWFSFFSFALLAVGFLLLFLWRTSILLRVAFIVAAVGWALLALDSVVALGSAVVTIGGVLALIGTLVSGILVFVRHLFKRNTNIVFLIMAIFGAIVLLTQLGWVASLGATLTAIIVVIFAVMLLVSGWFIQRRG